jgi:hypothetical protein
VPSFAIANFLVDGCSLSSCCPGGETIVGAFDTNNLIYSEQIMLEHLPARRQLPTPVRCRTSARPLPRSKRARHQCARLIPLTGGRSYRVREQSSRPARCCCQWDARSRSKQNLRSKKQSGRERRQRERGASAIRACPSRALEIAAAQGEAAALL